MAYTVDDLRLILRDTDSAVFSDEQLELYRSLFPDSIFRAAAFAIRSWAIEASASGTSIKTDDLAVDLKSRGADLLAVARSFLDEADDADNAAANDFFQIVPFGGRKGRACVRPEGALRPRC